MILLVWVIRCKSCFLTEASSGALLLHFQTAREGVLKIHRMNCADIDTWRFTHLENAVQLLCFRSCRKKTGLFKYNFPFSLAKVNKLMCYEQIYLYLGEDNFFVFTKSDTGVHQWKNRDVTLSLIWKNISHYPYYYYCFYNQDFLKASRGLIGLLDFSEKFREESKICFFAHIYSLHISKASLLCNKALI